MTDIDTLAAALGDGYRLIDHDDFWQIVRTDGEHVAITIEELAVQFDLSVIIFPPDEDQMYALAEEADNALRAHITPVFIEAGFGVAEEGSIQAAEGEDGETTVYSFELPVVTRAEDPAMVLDILEWVEEQQTEFFLFESGQELVPAMPV